MRSALPATIAGLVLASSLFLGCASTSSGNDRLRSGTAPSADRAIQAGMPQTEALEARRLYVLKCAKCHAFYEPAQYEEAEWHGWMSKMSAKANLSDAETSLLDRYLRAFRD